ncbi:AraC family transcriptional regulator [Pedobacter duraquae]|uniref:AraC-like DNA-binding protein n=1 Tax=Pedobacter duraquae TaxID=425511 RepID=A0A4R6IGK3_9SPHI|nr:AraC family transcriptional regulator [Pedobacter duraquae]TDO20858.1 AraC-like DNA-binding protein [Pedobacter duraquae]
MKPSERRKNQAIPVNKFGDESNAGITIERISFEDLPELGEWEQPERHDRHSFFLLEKGIVVMEIDFEYHKIPAPAVIYMHPDQVHRIIGFENVIVTALAVTNEVLTSEYLQLLGEISPTAPTQLKPETHQLLEQSFSLCAKIAERNKDQLHTSILKAQGNAVVGLVIAMFYAQLKPTNKSTRAEAVTKNFRQFLERHFTELKRPADYADLLHISIPYLNECVKAATGQAVSQHIQQRVILEARRLLYHSGQSLKEISLSLGYEDYTYFSRLFTKVVGISPLAFRQKNCD